MTRQGSNLVLIGMPGSGKSTIGVLLAKRAAFCFVDTDLLIQARAGQRLQAIVDAQGSLALRRIEQQVLLDLECQRHVIATGGSAVYSRAAMTHLARHGCIVFLDVPLTELEARISDWATRGIARRPGQSLAQLFQERHRLYTRWADIVLPAAGLTQEQACTAVLERWGGL
jgi:shikimate kinase